MPTRRHWQLAIALIILLLIATTAAFYSYAKHRANQAWRELPGKLAANIAQKAVGFTYSKSEGGHTLFTIKASELVQFKDGVHAELHNVSILVYGREGDRYDQIYGDKFSYDQKTQEVRADGPVSIDLQANPHGSSNQDQSAPEEIKNPIHLKTSGLVFSQATGIAQTAEKIEFRTPQGEGTALGATYDTHNGSVRFEHNVNLTAFAEKQRQTLTASSAVFSQTENKQKLAEFESVTIRDPEREIKARKLDVYLRPDNTLDRITAGQGVESHSLTGARNSIAAVAATVLAGENNQITHANLHGNVRISTAGVSAESADAALKFNGHDKAVLESADLTGGATVRQPDGSQLQSQALHLDLRPDRSLAAASTSTPAILTLLEAAAQRTTTISAGRMNAAFGSASHIQSLHAAPDVRIISTDARTKTQRTSASQSLDAAFSNSGKAALTRIIESGNVHITEGDRLATAERAEYDPLTQRATLTGSPRLTDKSAGMSASAQRIQIDSANGHASAEGDVRLTYTATRPQNGADGLFSGSAPVHAIAVSAGLDKSPSGDALTTLRGSPARLWQDANLIEAPLITFDRDNRTMAATGSSQSSVTTSFVQSNNSGQLVPINVTAQALHYSEENRRANFIGGVTIQGNGSAITSQSLTVQLLPPGAHPQKTSGQTSGQIDKITASGNVTLNQDSPPRHGTGDRLLYTAQDAKFVLTGTPKSAPSIFDAEHGSVTGDSLTFYGRDDRVLVESHGKPTVTHTKIASTK